MFMPHTLKTITDADNYFVIDPITRTITNQTNKNSLTQYDHNSEVFTFKIPLMVEGHDMSSSDVIQIHYINKGQNNSKPGIYEVSDSMVITEDGVAYIVFSWLVSQNATSLTGDITFQIKFICYDKTNPLWIDYSWGTKVFSAINVLPGINNTEIIVEEYADILQQWKTDVTNKTQIKNAIIIGNASNGATTDTCDVLYETGMDFVNTFNAAYDLATERNINTIKILSGTYELNGEIILHDGIEVIGDSVQSPRLSMKISVTELGSSMFATPAAFLYFSGGNINETYVFENVQFDHVNVFPFHVIAKCLTLKNVSSNAITDEFMVIPHDYPSKVYIENCTLSELILTEASDSYILNNTIETLTLESETSKNVVIGNNITVFTDDGTNNIVRNNIINGSPQSSGEGGVGENGKSAYEIALDNGFVGSEEEWLASLKGEPETKVAELTSDMLINSGKIYVGYGETSKSAVIPINKGESIKIKISGKHNRFNVGGVEGTEIVHQTPVDVLYNSNNSGTRDIAESYEYVNNDKYSHIVVSVSYNLTDVSAIVEYTIYPLPTTTTQIYVKENIFPYISRGDKVVQPTPPLPAVQTRPVKALYSQYDELISRYPDYVSMTILGTDSSNKELREYTFSTPNYNTQEASREKDDVGAILEKPVILLISGVHGYEFSSSVATLQFLSDLCVGNNALSRLRESYIFKVIPVVTPYSYEEGTRINSNGVNINRNFDSGWKLTQTGPDYSGAAAADQPETQIVQNWIDNNTTAKLFIDFHSSGYDNEITYLAADNSFEGIIELKQKFLKGIDNIIPYWKTEEGFKSSIDVNGETRETVFSYTGNFTGYGGMAYLYAQDKGVLSCCLETSLRMNGEEKYSHLTVKTGAEALGNMLIEVLS